MLFFFCLKEKGLKKDQTLLKHIMSKKVYGRNHTGQNSHKAWEPYKWKWQLHIHSVETENNIRDGHYDCDYS